MISLLWDPILPTYQHDLDTIIQICDYPGVPLALEKMEGPLTTLPFLGIVLNRTRMEARLPEDKLLKLQQDIAQWISYIRYSPLTTSHTRGILRVGQRVGLCGCTHRNA